jgi:hypothetical protein
MASELCGKCELSAFEQERGDHQHGAAKQVGAADHRLAPDGVEQAAAGERTEQVPDRERSDVTGDVAAGDREERFRR